MRKIAKIVYLIRIIYIFYHRHFFIILIRIIFMHKFRPEIATIPLHDHDEDHDHEEHCCCGHHHHDDDDDEDEHEHHHEHGGHCCCGHHHHHHDHDADEVFTSWGVETARKFTKAEVEHALTELDTGNYGMILRSKGIVDGGADGWLEFDYVPGEWEVRARGADVGGKLVVIGSKLNEKAIAELFGC